MTRADKRYPTRATPDVLPIPRTRLDWYAHLRGEHDWPRGVLDGARVKGWQAWHRGEHKARKPHAKQPMHAGHLGHTHDGKL